MRIHFVSLADEGDSGRAADEVVGVPEDVEEDAPPGELLRVEPDQEVEAGVRLNPFSNIHGG